MKIRCTHCQKEYEVSNSYQNAVIECSGCGKDFVAKKYETAKEKRERQQRRQNVNALIFKFIKLAFFLAICFGGYLAYNKFSKKSAPVTEVTVKDKDTLQAEFIKFLEETELQRLGDNVKFGMNNTVAKYYQEADEIEQKARKKYDVQIIGDTWRYPTVHKAQVLSLLRQYNQKYEDALRAYNSTKDDFNSIRVNTVTDFTDKYNDFANQLEFPLFTDEDIVNLKNLTIWLQLDLMSLVEFKTNSIKRPVELSNNFNDKIVNLHRTINSEPRVATLEMKFDDIYGENWKKHILDYLKGYKNLAIEGNSNSISEYEKLLKNERYEYFKENKTQFDNWNYDQLSYADQYKLEELCRINVNNDIYTHGVRGYDFTAKKNTLAKKLIQNNIPEISAHQIRYYSVYSDNYSAIEKKIEEIKNINQELRLQSFIDFQILPNIYVVDFDEHGFVDMHQKLLDARKDKLISSAKLKKELEDLDIKLFPLEEKVAEYNKIKSNFDKMLQMEKNVAEVKLEELSKEIAVLREFETQQYKCLAKEHINDSELSAINKEIDIIEQRITHYSELLKNEIANHPTVIALNELTDKETKLEYLKVKKEINNDKKTLSNDDIERLNDLRKKYNYALKAEKEKIKLEKDYITYDDIEEFRELERLEQGSLSNSEYDEYVTLCTSNLEDKIQELRTRNIAFANRLISDMGDRIELAREKVDYELEEHEDLEDTEEAEASEDIDESEEFADDADAETDALEDEEGEDETDLLDDDVEKDDELDMIE